MFSLKVIFYHQDSCIFKFYGRDDDESAIFVKNYSSC